MFGCHHFQVTKDDSNPCFIAFSSPQAATQPPQNGVLVEVFHPSYGFIIRVHHYYSDREWNNNMYARHQIDHPALPATFDAQLWPRHVKILLGDVVWEANNVLISERRARKISKVYITEFPCESEPGTPFEDDETQGSDSE